ncbi:MAG: LysM peptidoglycan-binding domain-containing protein [Cytophagales bacterium]|nr:MAG: LysM peptidoglycan-binding domain-containing protein [Cytophagales bacterium]
MKTNLYKTLLLNLLLLFGFPSFGETSLLTLADSIGMTKKEDKYFIMHKIASGETLSGIAKKYKVSIADLQKANAEILKKDKIKAGQLLLVPARNVSMPPTNPPTANKKNNSSLKEKLHLVKEHESLYKIAAMNNVHVDSVKAWNKLSDNNIKANTKIIVGYHSQAEEPFVPSSGENLARESGMGEMILGTSNNELKLALHRTLPAGSYVRVFNEGNKSNVVVKIIGKIPDVDADQKVIIKLSQAACKAIGMVNERFPITITYEKKKK